jgi:hypothetical protein
MRRDRSATTCWRIDGQNGRNAFSWYERTAPARRRIAPALPAPSSRIHGVATVRDARRPTSARTVAPGVDSSRSSAASRSAPAPGGVRKSGE